MEEPPDGFGSQRSLPGAGSRAARGGDALCAGTVRAADSTENLCASWCPSPSWQRFPGVWCIKSHPAVWDGRGWFWGNKETQGLNTSGLSVQGSASIVAPILLKNSSAQGRVPGRGDPGQLRAGPGLRPPLAAGAHGEGAQEHPAVPAPQPQELHLDLRRLLRHDRVN
ncbi:uncharacterized protein LOC131574229 isoform X5 [Poecile atricapillus]|uniref:uncharacterized protein LOC131574229 isoform X5 n=1 Tax=Poecile atricapillus TaxID=48891 RepID=UPI0027393DFA|nr:uncharacterized protein LOC131574229 isoform X5 [Poecile atricapillus]